jgi:metal-responsive CopG/Arc/MetJ family transcriptional regulator
MSNFILKSKKIKQEKVVISVRMDEAVLNTIEQALINTNISRNEFINQAIEYALNHMEKKKLEE